MVIYWIHLRILIPGWDLVNWLFWREKKNKKNQDNLRQAWNQHEREPGSSVGKVCLRVLVKGLLLLNHDFFLILHVQFEKKKNAVLKKSLYISLKFRVLWFYLWKDIKKNIQWIFDEWYISFETFLCSILNFILNEACH